MPITPALQLVTWCLLLTSVSMLWVAGLLSPLLVAASYAAIGLSAIRVRLGGGTRMDLSSDLASAHTAGSSRFYD